MNTCSAHTLAMPLTEILLKMALNTITTLDQIDHDRHKVGF